MSRPKFRIWKGDYFETIGFCLDEMWDYDKFHLNDRSINPDCLNQWTGLKDLNGVDIYEGDVCQYFKGEPLQVVWDAQEVRFKLKKLTGYKGHLRFDCGLEVIGNKYQNPELFEESK